MSFGKEPKRYTSKVKSAITLIFAALAIDAAAWHASGHMVVAEVAYRNLTPRARSQVQGLLAAAQLDEKCNEFRTASVWADDHKTDKDAPWHYINTYFRTDGKRAKGKPLDQNVVWAIRKFKAELGDPSLSDERRGKALVWLLHFVGDIHQPMHAVAFESDSLPNGDRGGNDTKLIPPPGLQPEPRNLHFLWDMGAGAFPEVVRPLNDVGQRTIARLADLAEEAVKERQVGKDREDDPGAWARESFELAIKYAYDLTPGSAPSSMYLERCRQLSLWRVGMAGFRLARLINAALG